jgi:hypothetical protein
MVKTFLTQSPAPVATEESPSGTVTNPYENPKDIMASTKLPLDLVPSVVTIESSLAFLEGALKYGRANWRKTPVKATVYYAAMLRHTLDWMEGQDRDPRTKVRHLGSAIACLGIIMDAELNGTLIDDRPPSLSRNGDFTYDYIDKQEVVLYDRRC